ncbi:hypothetical protein NY_014-154 [NY_014 poxvirus]|uniref:hypothetical protein n=1 Tax=NY_014 poxvirus TaxID=2025360 RepID=UPI000B9A1522|nr:hypothetical protein CKM51_gp154 [NY_014 poxvirus]AST09555.1 hypothetical protein NY_014-154 [NY_014 poxvirus]
MDKIKVIVDSKVGNIVTIYYNLDKITIDVVPKKKKDKLTSNDKEDTTSTHTNNDEENDEMDM